MILGRHETMYYDEAIEELQGAIFTAAEMLESGRLRSHMNS
jgi:hypothetical protein